MKISEPCANVRAYTCKSVDMRAGRFPVTDFVTGQGDTNNLESIHRPIREEFIDECTLQARKPESRFSI